MTLLLLVAAVLIIALSALAIAWPVLRREEVHDQEGSQAAEAPEDEDPLQELEARRASIYLAIRELRFDHQVGKVSEADYEIFDSQLKAQAVAVLKEIDALEAAAADPVLDKRLEAEIAALRRNGREPAGPVAGGKPGGFCPQCGQAVGADDRFCGSCGSALS